MFYFEGTTSCKCGSKSWLKSDTITCLVTTCCLSLNSSNYRDSFYVKWFGASFCIATSRWADPGSIVKYIHSELCMSVHHLLRNFAEDCPKSCDIATVLIVWGIHSELCMSVHHLLRNFAEDCPKSCDIATVLIVWGIRYKWSSSWLYQT